MSLYDAGLASFGEDDTYDHADAGGFIKLFGLPARVAAERDAGVRESEAAVTEMLKSVTPKTPVG